MSTLVATKREYEKAKFLVLRHLLEDGPCYRSSFGRFHQWGISRVAIELVITELIASGVIEQLLILDREGRGNKPTILALRAELDKGKPLPEGTMRVKDALVQVTG